MELIQNDGFVIMLDKEYYIVECPNAKIVRVPRKLSPVELQIGDEVFVKAEYWNYKRAPEHVTRLNVRYKAISIQRNIGPETVSNEKASVVVRFFNRSFLIQYGKDAVYCPPSICYQGMEEDDIVMFSAESYPNPPTSLSQNKCKLEVTYRCTKLKFIKKPETIEATGFLGITDGQCSFVEGTCLEAIEKVSIFLHVSVVQPACTDLTQMFQPDTPLRMMIIEQGANRRNNRCHWRAVRATDDQHRITEDGGVLKVVPFAKKENPPSAANYPLPPFPSPSSRKIANIIVKPPLESRDVPSQQMKKEDKLPPRPNKTAIAAIPFDPHASPLEEANRKLRLIAHYLLTDGPCKVCLTAENFL